MEKKGCANHVREIHDCIEKIINGFRYDMNKHVPHKDHIPHLMVTCAQVNSMLAHASEAVFHRKDHEMVWESVVSQHKHDLMCKTCGIFFTNLIIEKARKIGIL